MQDSDVERALINKVLETKDYGPISDGGITEKFFVDPTNKRVFKTLVSLQVEHGQVPTVGMMRREFPKYKFLSVEEPFDYLIEELRHLYALAVLEEALSNSIERYDEADVESVKQILATAMSTLANDIVVSHDTNIKYTGDQRWERYQEIAKRDPDEYLGVPMGFPTIDQATQGFQDKQLVTFVGPPKAGKSTIMLLAAIAAWRAGKKVLFIGFEMSNEEQEQRLDSFVAKIDHSRLRGGKDKQMTKKDWDRLDDALQYLSEGADFILSNDTQNTLTLSGIAAKVDKYQPDIVFVDGIYMMEDENGEDPNTPRALTNITRGFKRMCQNKVKPFVISTQVLLWKMDKKKGVTSGSIGYSSSFIQDSDVIISVEPLDDDLPNYNKIKILLGRNVAPGVETFVKWDWGTATFEEVPEDPREDMGEDDSGYDSPSY